MIVFFLGVSKRKLTMVQKKRVPFEDDPNAERRFWEGVVPLITLIATFVMMGLHSVVKKPVGQEPVGKGVEYPVVNMTEFRR